MQTSSPLGGGAPDPRSPRSRRTGTPSAAASAPIAGARWPPRWCCTMTTVVPGSGARPARRRARSARRAPGASLTTATTTTSTWPARSAGEAATAAVVAERLGGLGANVADDQGQPGPQQRWRPDPVADVAETDDPDRRHRPGAATSVGPVSGLTCPCRRSSAARGRRSPCVGPSRRGPAGIRTAVQTIVWTHDRSHRPQDDPTTPATSIRPTSATRTSPGRRWSGWCASTP